MIEDGAELIMDRFQVVLRIRFPIVLLGRQKFILSHDDVSRTDITDLPVFEERQDLRPDNVFLGASGVLSYTAFLICRVEIHETPKGHIQRCLHRRS